MRTLSFRMNEMQSSHFTTEAYLTAYFLNVEKLQFGLCKNEMSNHLKFGHGGPGKSLQES